MGYLSLLLVFAAPDALAQLRAAEAPRFAPGHTLPPLTRWGWQMPFEVRLELCERWGYALEFGGYATAEAAARLDDPASEESRLCALTAADPKRYPLFVLTQHFWRDGEAPEEAFCHDAAGQRLGEQPVWSPEAPDAVFRQAGERWAAPLRRIRQAAPIAIVLNGGEYALSVEGHHAAIWAQDPKVAAARGERSWFDYISERKARQERIISEALRAAVPDRLLYLYYTTWPSPHRHRYAGWDAWAWDWQRLRGISDLTNGEGYYNHFNSGWTGANDLLTQVLNATAQALAAGDRLSYNWVCGGWVRENLGPAAFSDHARYMGFLKCWYTAGMTGGVAGYFSYPAPADPGWLWQMTTLAHVHAAFSHLEGFLREGDLLPGPNRHVWSTELPAYELPTGDATARVLARRHRARPEWLLCAWAADGPAREVSVDLPELGRVTLEADPAGALYRVVAGAVRRLDPDPLRPSAAL